ncbi:uncharacterized protein LOC117176508 [Belonocnema kinseyi]|uniref:uncharacterized protein LOC117176508 n=1 Tax=Belonocnema kinseyi TaxID=2817044 RepID=UPI00143D53AC|nr:uncharacterized protein LOC117176508 [Belonocnema kinseyi]
MCNIVHGKLWRKVKEKFGEKIVIPLIIYFDEYETNSSQGSHNGVDKIGATYFMLPTLPPHFQSSLKDIFLTLLFRDSDRKVHGNRAAFRPLLKELKDLEVNGSLFNNVSVYFSCIIITGDNLGIHQICGFVESFSGNHVCRLCMVAKEQLRRRTEEDPALLRKMSDYETGIKKSDVSVTRLKEYCVWNDGFLDSMHDFWEGVCPYDLSAMLLNYLGIKLFSIEDINDRIMAFNYGPVDKGNAVPYLKKEKLKQNRLGFSASETLTFVKYLGLIIGDCIPENDEYWNLYLILRNIGDLLSLRYFNRDCIVLLKTLITEHHEVYIKLFGETLKPKHYLLLHYPTIIYLIGPVRNVWCTRPKAKHEASKVTAHLSNSRVNLPYTLALKHQFQQCYSFICKDSLIHKVEYGHDEVITDKKLANIATFWPLISI